MTVNVAAVTSTVPFTTTWSFSVPTVEPLISTENVVPVTMDKFPLMVSLPMGPPGARIPRVWKEAFPLIVPVPPRVAVLFAIGTILVALEIEPFTKSVPSSIRVLPVYVWAPVRVIVPECTFFTDPAPLMIPG